METIIYDPDGSLASNTAGDVSDATTNPIDTRGGYDAIQGAELVDIGGGTSTSLTSIGQGAAGDPAAGEVAVVSDSELAFGDTIPDPGYVRVTLATLGDERPL